MTRGRGAILPALALAGGAILLAFTLLRADLPSLGALGWQLGAALPVALIPGGLWHVVRTAAWQRCFPAAQRIPFARLFRVRLAAEAFSFVTIRGVAGEPLKVALLPEAPPATAAAAVALERVAYVVVTLVIVGVAAAVAMATLPLSREWFRVFRALAIAAAVLMVSLAALMARRPADEDAVEVGARGEPRGRVSRALARFAREVRQRWRELAYGDRRRFASILALEAAAYVLMALEVWVVLRAMGVPVSAAGATAVETFTRVASMLSAFVPGGIGVLEASNVAAATAVAAGGGAAALAIVRRIRGLVWCAAGFLVVPGLRATVAPGQRGGPPAAANGRRCDRTLLVIDDAPFDAEVALADPLGGLPLAERVVRAAVHEGFGRIVVRSPQRADGWAPYLAQAAEAIDGVAGRDALAAGAVEVRHVPVTRAALAAAEQALRRSIVKPTDGTLARFNRRISTPISVWLIRRLRLSANAMSLVVLAIGLYAGWLFARGDYASGVVAAAISLAASILDGCDGELARLQYQTTRFGCWLDTLGDYAYYVAVFVGLAVGAVRRSGDPAYWWLGGALLAGAFLTFWLLILLRQRATAGRPEALHARTKAHFKAGNHWKRLLAKISFVATRAAMPYGVLAFALAGALPVLLVLAAIGAHVYWISLALELRRLLASARPAGEPAARSEPLPSI